MPVVSSRCIGGAVAARVPARRRVGGDDLVWSATPVALEVNSTMSPGSDCQLYRVGGFSAVMDVREEAAGEAGSGNQPAHRRSGSARAL